MTILIDNSGGVPIYEQIYNQIKTQIINDTLKEDEMLPSIRSLAKDLRISVITTKRAYEELERENYIYTVTGKGSFVAKKNIEFLREENLKTIEELMDRIIKLAAVCNLTIDDIVEMFRVIGEED
jgi:GntR family transcriptional regulator